MKLLVWSHFSSILPKRFPKIGKVQYAFLKVTCTHGNHFHYCTTFHIIEASEIISKALRLFGNLCAYKPSALCKNPSAFLKDAFQLLEEAF